MTSATETLRREHDRILDVLDAFQRTLERSDVETVNAGLVEGFLEFFRLFVGRCHHGKEEDLLFPALEGHGLSPQQGALSVMLEEHRRGKALVARMARALPAVRRGEPAAWTDFAETGRDYIHLLQGHIGKENPAVFDTADRLVRGPACRRLCEAYASVDDQHMEGRTADDLERLALSLLSGAPRGPRGRTAAE